MVTPERIAHQIVPIIKLAQHLTEYQCVEGAKLVEAYISSSLTNVDDVDALGKKLVEMDIENLCKLFFKVHNASCGESYPFYLVIIRHFCELLLSRMEEGKEERSIHTTKPGTILNVLKGFTLFGDRSLTHSLLQHLCDCKENGTHFKQNLLKSFVSSSEIWGKLDSDLRLMILNSSTALVEKESANISRKLNFKPEQSAGPSRNPPHTPKSNLLDCAKFFILIEKHKEKQRFQQQKNASLTFKKLCTELPTNLLLDLVLEIHVTETKSSSSIKMFSCLIKWYTDLWRRLLKQDFLSFVEPIPDYFSKHLFHTSCTYKIIRCLLWLDDDESWQCFARQIAQLILKSFPCKKSDMLMRAFLKDTEMQEAVKGSSFAYASFSCIVDSLVNKWKSVKEPSSFTWEQPANLPRNRRGYEDIENFLRSTRESMVFSGFVNIHEARTFARQLESMGSSNGFSVRVTASGSGRSSRLEIDKKTSFYETVVKEFATRKLELAKLVDLRRTLHDGRSKGKQTLETVDCSSSQAKRVKLK